MASIGKLIASKRAKGYQEPEAQAAATNLPTKTIWNSDGTDGPCLICPPPKGRPLVIAATNEGNDTGIRCQLLNPADPADLGRLLANHTHCLQQKHDGRRVLVCKRGTLITGINRRGLVITLPDAIHQAAAAIPGDFLIDGEAVGETLHAFDLLELEAGYSTIRQSVISTATATCFSCWTGSTHLRHHPRAHGPHPRRQARGV